MSKRDWKSARAKVDSEDGLCRVCGRPYSHAGHIIDRSLCAPGPELGEHPDNICPLCPDATGMAGCHWLYDNGKLDLLPYLSKEEQAHAVKLVGLISALERTTNQKWVPVENDVAKAA